MRKIIQTTTAPEAIGPYSQAVQTNGLLFISGQIPLDPETGNITEGNIGQQTRRVMQNIEAILKEAGYDFEDVVKCSCYLKSISDFQQMNDVYGSYFIEKHPARVAFEVCRLPKDVLIEIDAIAVK